jgi:hypothetical protein
LIQLVEHALGCDGGQWKSQTVAAQPSATWQNTYRVNWQKQVARRDEYASISSMMNFPPLRIGLLQGLISLKQSYDADSTILNESPYENEMKTILARLFAPKVVEKIVEKEVIREVKAGRGRPTKDVSLSAEDQEKVRDEIGKLMTQLNNLGTGEGEGGEGGLETNERIQIIKTKASLLQQLLQMQERVFNIKRMSSFQETVILILDDLVSEDDREVFLKRIEPYRD